MKNFGLYDLKANEKIIEVPNTVRATFYSDYKLSLEISNQYSNKFVLLYIGDTGLRRGLETVIKSINKIKARGIFGAVEKKMWLIASLLLEKII